LESITFHETKQALANSFDRRSVDDSESFGANGVISRHSIDVVNGGLVFGRIRLYCQELFPNDSSSEQALTL